MNTVLVIYGHSVRTKQNTKKQNAKYAVKAEISMKTIMFNDSAKRSAFSQMSRIAFFYDVIGNMAIATSVDARGNLRHRKRPMLRL